MNVKLTTHLLPRDASKRVTDVLFSVLLKYIDVVFMV